MPELIGIGLILAAAVALLSVVVVWDFLRQRLRLSSAQYSAQIRTLEARITELELENQRLREELQWVLQSAEKRGRLPGQGPPSPN